MYQQWNAVVEDSILVDLIRPYLRDSDSLSGDNVENTPFLDDRFAACWRRPNIDPLCRLNIDPGTGAAVATRGCG